MCGRGITPHGGPNCSLHEAVKGKPGLPWRPQGVGDAMPRKAHIRTTAGESGVLQSAKLKGVGDLKSILTSGMEMRSLEFAQLVFLL